MTKPNPCAWAGVFPAATTQFDASLQVDLPATQKVQKALLDDGVHGLVLMGTVGEGNSLSADEKRNILRAAVEAERQRTGHCRCLGIHHRDGGAIRPRCGAPGRQRV